MEGHIFIFISGCLIGVGLSMIAVGVAGIIVTRDEKSKPSQPK